MGGGTGWPSSVISSWGGLSPRGRGNRRRLRPLLRRRRSIPAWAGEPCSAGRCGWRRAVYPRVGGGTYDRLWREVHECGLSPRGRGNRSVVCPPAESGRSIPAWAGEPFLARCGTPAPAVYPRVGGGTAEWLATGLDSGGLSPRGRGNRIARDRGGVIDRSIPAWAGEPRCGGFRDGQQLVYPRVGGGTGQ